MAAGLEPSPSPPTAPSAASVTAADQPPPAAPSPSKLENVQSDDVNLYNPEVYYYQKFRRGPASDHLGGRPASGSPSPRRLSLQNTRPSYDYPQVPPRAASRPTSGVFAHGPPGPGRPYYPQYHHHGPYWSPQQQQQQQRSTFSKPSSRNSSHTHQHRLPNCQESHPHQHLSDVYLDDRRDRISAKSPVVASSIGSSKPGISPVHLPDAFVTRSTYSESDLEDDPRSTSPQSAKSDVVDDSGDHTFRAWVHLSFTAPVMSIGVAIYAIISVVFVLVTLPFRLCSRSEETVGQQWTGLMLRPINMQRRLICFPALVAKDEFLPFHNQQPKELILETTLKGGAILLILLGSPVVSLGLAIACWIVGCFWAMSALVTDDRSGSLESNQPFRLNEKVQSDDGHNMARSLAVWWGDRWLAGGLFGASLHRRRSQTSVEGMRERRRS